MSVVASVLMVIGTVLILLGAVGILRFPTAYSRFHAAGKASPVGFVFIAAGAAIELGIGPAGTLAVAVGAMVVTLPIGVHLLFRATYRHRDEKQPD